MTDTATDPERQSLIAANEFQPVDRVVVRSRARRCGLGVAVACCLGVGLSLAIALPLSNRDTGGAASDGGTQPVEVRMMLKSGQFARPNEQQLPSDNPTTQSSEPEHHWETDRTTTPSWSTPWWWQWTTQKPMDTPTSPKHHHHHHHHGDDHGDESTADDYEQTAISPTWDPNQERTSPTWWPWWWHWTTQKPIDTTTTASHHHLGNETTTDDNKPTTTTPMSDWNHGTASTTWWPWWWNMFSTTIASATTVKPPNDERSTSGSPQTATTQTTAELPESCPRLLRGNRSRVDVQDVISRPYWYELTRIQTSNSPAYVEQISCSTMRLNTTSPNDVEALLTWEEGRSHHRQKKHVTLFLHREDSTSDDWLEVVNDINSTEHNQLSLLAQIDDFLLIYECFPRVNWYPNPGYVIHVYSTDPRPNYYGKQIADLLLAVVELWGLNPNQEAPYQIRQRHCDTDIGYA